MAKKPPEPWQPMLLDVKPPATPPGERRVEYDPVPKRRAAREEPVFAREPRGQRDPEAEAPWAKRAQAAATRAEPAAPVRWGQAWLRLLRADGWLVDLPAGLREGFERSVRGLACRSGVVEAAFADGVHRPHRVQLRLGAFTAAEWARIARKIVDDRTGPAVREAAARDTVPTALLMAADATGFTLLPRRLALVQATCTCGGARLPCDHVVAVHLSLARLLDERPWALVTVRGGSAALLDDLLTRARSGAESVGATETLDSPGDPFAAGDRSGLDWRLLDPPPRPRAPLPQPDGWRGRETFDALARRLLDRARTAAAAGPAGDH